MQEFATILFGGKFSWDTFLPHVEIEGHLAHKLIAVPDQQERHEATHRTHSYTMAHISLCKQPRGICIRQTLRA